MSITVSVVTDEGDFNEITPMAWDAWQSPYNPQLKHFRSVVDTRAEAVAFGNERALKAFRKKGPKMFMLKATDEDTNSIIGFAQWYVNDKPDPYGERIVATWHPEGSDEREFAERFINGLWKYIGDRVTRPHMGEWRVAALWIFCLRTQTYIRSPCIPNIGAAALGGYSSAGDSTRPTS